MVTRRGPSSEAHSTSFPPSEDNRDERSGSADSNTIVRPWTAFIAGVIISALLLYCYTFLPPEHDLRAPPNNSFPQTDDTARGASLPSELGESHAESTLQPPPSWIPQSKSSISVIESPSAIPIAASSPPSRTPVVASPVITSPSPVIIPVAASPIAIPAAVPASTRPPLTAVRTTLASSPSPRAELPSPEPAGPSPPLTSLQEQLGASCASGSDELACHLARVLEGCGDVCETSDSGHPQAGFPFNFVAKRVDCAALWANTAIDAGRSGPPTVWAALPAAIRREFEMGGRVVVAPWRRGLLNDKYLGNPAPLAWDAALIGRLTAQCKKGGAMRGNYGKATTVAVFKLLQQMPALRGGHVLVIGSETPWVEACALAAGAARVTTLEYRPIVSTVPTVATLTPDAARAAFAAGTLPAFDAVVTYSSIEHSGLTRYGDALNPWGDLQAMARAWCVVRRGGEALVGVPRSLKSDLIEWNAHRVYGPARWPHLLANWALFGSDDLGAFEFPREFNGAFIARRKEAAEGEGAVAG